MGKTTRPAHSAFLNAAGVSDSLLQYMQPETVRWLPRENPAGVSYDEWWCRQPVNFSLVHYLMHAVSDRVVGGSVESQ